MTQEDKELLLKDLCARLPYKPIVHTECNYMDDPPYYKLKHAEADRILEINDFYEIWNVKPYLRPMSSMTEEECYEWNVMVDNCRDEFDSCFVDYCNRKHFDYRGLIEKGLAIEAPEGMYN